MANFDPALRRETWVFQKLFDEKGRPVYRRMRFNFVEYDGSPDRYIEPVSMSDFYDILSADVLQDDDRGRVVGFEFYTGRPFEVHSFDDNVGS